jgi:hypothetical protein
MSAAIMPSLQSRAGRKRTAVQSMTSEAILPERPQSGEVQSGLRRQVGVRFVLPQPPSSWPGRYSILNVVLAKKDSLPTCGAGEYMKEHLEEEKSHQVGRSGHWFARDASPQVRIAIFLCYALMLGGLALHLYRWPIYSMDSIQYMGNALLMDDTDIVRVHHRVYSELMQHVPKGTLEPLLGNRPGAPDDQNASRRQRQASSACFAEFLPLFAIRPLYNQTLWLVSRTGLGLVRAGILISVASYFGMGILLLVWIREYTVPVLSFLGPLLVMASPPLIALGRETTADALATLVAFSSLYLIFETKLLAPGFVLLLASIYFRTDFVVLAVPTILVCCLQRRIDVWQASVLGSLAVASALCINHFAGDYGLRMLYYRNFVGTPIMPAEMEVHFSLGDYVRAFGNGTILVLDSFFFPFMLLGAIGLAAKRTRPLFIVALAYVILHFIVLPNWQERWFGLFYLSMGVTAMAVTRARFRGGDGPNVNGERGFTLWPL